MKNTLVSNGTCTLMHGDCLELLPDIPDKSIDLICCDMPYGTTQCKWDTPLDLSALWGQYLRVAKETCAIILFAQTPFDKVLGCSQLDLLKYELIWEKTSATGHLNANKMPLKAHENILVFYRKLPTYNPQKTKGHARKACKARAPQESDCYGKQPIRSDYDSAERFPRSVQVFKSDKQTSRLHPTQKPEVLMEWIIKTYSNEGDTVLDNCMGSGTTGAACLNTNRKFIGMELDIDYFNKAGCRLGLLA